jgi:hypothetical protein
MSGFSGREFGRGNVAVRHVAVLVGFQWRLPYSRYLIHGVFSTNIVLS